MKFNSSVILATFQVLSGHMQLVITILNRADVAHFLHHKVLLDNTALEESVICLGLQKVSQQNQDPSVIASIPNRQEYKNLILVTLTSLFINQNYCTYHLTPIRMAAIKKKQKITSVDEVVEELEFLCNVGENVK